MVSANLTKIAIFLALTIGRIPVVLADHAVVVGINHYAGFEEEDHIDLRGCINDAQGMKRLFQHRGYEVTMMKDWEATKAGILQELKKMQTLNKSTERFVFFFAGHGYQNGTLLPYDVLPPKGGESHLISASELYDAIRKIPARGRTAILDSCYSASMTRDMEPGERSRYFDINSYLERKRGQAAKDQSSQMYVSSDSNQPRLISHKSITTKWQNGDQASDAEDMSDIAPGRDVCYFAAALRNEEAGESDKLSPPSGYFTHCLTSYLESHPAVEKITCAELQRAVGEQVARLSNRKQHPKISPSYWAVGLFEGPLGPRPSGDNPAIISTLWDVDIAQHPDTQRLRLTLNPDKTLFQVGDSLTFSAQIGSIIGSTKGYLLVLECDAEGRITLWSPISRTIDGAEVWPGQIRPVPARPRHFDTSIPGIQNIKALLFTDREQAEMVLNSIPPEGVLWSQAQSIKLEHPISESYYTSEVDVSVAPISK